MNDRPDYTFEPAPDLPGADRFSKYFLKGIRALMPRLWDFDIEGRENIPRTGPALITPNHLSFSDSIFVPAALPRRAWAIGKGEYMDSWKTKHLFPAMGMIPVDRSGGDAAQAALDTAAKVLDDGRLFMIYPEGTRSRSGDLHKGRTGAARLAVRCNAPIIPTGLQGTLDVQPPDAIFMKPGVRVEVRFGEPMWAQDFGDPDDPRLLRRFTDAVMYEISQLSGQRYVDVYAGKETATSTDTATAPADRPAADEEPITPRRPSIVGSSPGAPLRPVAAHPNGSDGERTISVPPGRPSPSSADGDGGLDTASIGVPPGRRVAVAAAEA